MKINKKQLKKLIEQYLLKEYHPDFGDYTPKEKGEVRDDFKTMDDILYAIQPFILGFGKIWKDKSFSLPVRGFAKFWMDDNTAVTEKDLTSEQKKAIFNIVDSLADSLFSGDESGTIKKGITYSMFDQFAKGSPVSKMFNKPSQKNDYVSEEEFTLDQEIIHFLGQFYVRNYKDYYLIEDYYDFNNVYYDPESPHWKRNSLPKFLSGFAATASTVGKFTLGTLFHGSSPEKVLYQALREAGDIGMQFGLKGYPIKIKIDKNISQETGEQ